MKTLRDLLPIRAKQATALGLAPVFALPAAALLAVLGIAIVSYQTSQQAEQALEERTLANVRDIGAAARATIEKFWIDPWSQAALRLTQSADLQCVIERDDQACLNELRKNWSGALRVDENIFFIYFGLADGRIHLMPDDEPLPADFDMKNRPWYIAGMNTQTDLAWTTIYKEIITGQSIITVVAPLRNSDKKTIGVFSVDISLKKLNTTVKNIYLPTGAAVVLYDGQGNRLEANGARAVLESQNLPTPRNDPGLDYFSIDGHPYLRLTSALMSNGWRMELFVESPSQGAATLSAEKILLISLLAGLLILTLTLGRTLRQLNTQNAQLASANIQLQEMDQLKSNFLSSVSHELRTPLTSIRGFASLIEREFSRSFTPLAKSDAALQRKSERISDNLGVILTESERLTRLINDVLDLAKIESGRCEWRDSPLPIRQLLEQAANATQGMFSIKPTVALQIEVADNLPDFFGDVDRMQQVLINLLNNALKFTDTGTVTLAAALTTDGMLCIEVRDSGSGFPPEDAEIIFDKFQQARQGDTLTDRPKGTGLGLAICREIVKHHGGRIWASSTPGKGSVFAFTLPPATGSLLETTALTSRIAALAEPEVAGANPRAATSNAGHKPTVLVVDDDEGIRTYLTQLLQEQGYGVVSATDGQAAFAAARDHRPDLITMDLAMPVMDGHTAILKLRADPALQHIPIMVISALPGWEMAGGDMVMAKPLEEPRFLENVHLLLDGGQRSASRSAHLLVLHEASEAPALTPGNFSVQCEIEFCALDKLTARIQSGFQGMVVVPTHLIGSVDLNMLQATSSLEVMIMPIQPQAPQITENPSQ